MYTEKDDCVAFYILALIDFGLPISNLTERQQNELWLKILDSFRKHMPHEEFFVKGEIVEIEMPQKGETFKLAKIEHFESYVDFIKAPLIGYYNQRLIIRLTLKREDFFEIREHRDDILRDLKFVFENLTGVKVSVKYKDRLGEKPWKIKDIFYYPLIIVGNGTKLIKEEYRSAEENMVDPIFSIPSTSFTYKLPERGKWFSVFSFKEHFIRISVRSVMVFCDGWLPLEFTQILINAIFQGGIYDQMKRLRNVEKTTTRQRMRSIDDDILLNLAKIIQEQVETYIESARIAEKQRFIAFFIATLSFLISIVAFTFSVISRFG